MTIMITGDDLRRRRKAKKWTQDDLAQMVGVKGSAVGQWETGRTKPSWAVAQRLEEIFEGVTPDESTRIDRLEAEAVEVRAELAEIRDLVRRLFEAQPGE